VKFVYLFVSKLFIDTVNISVYNDLLLINHIMTDGEYGSVLV
jgi:hypothetical protein